MLASAWDWLEQCPSLWRAGQRGNHDERLVALAIVRVSATLELTPEGASVASQLLGTKEEQALLHELECRVVSLALAPRSSSLWRDDVLRTYEGVLPCLSKAEWMRTDGH